MNEKLLCAVALAVLWIFASPQKAQAQYCSYGVAYGASWTWQDDNAVYGYSATALDYCAGLYYDPAVYGRFTEGNFATENVRLLAEGYTEGYADWIPAEVLFSYGSPIGFQYYNTDSIHYVLEYYQYYACFSYCGYYWYDPWGFGFTNEAGPNFSGSGGISYWAVRRRRLGSTYHTIIYQPPDPCQQGQQFTSTGLPCTEPTPTPTPTGTPSQTVSVTYTTETQNNGIPMGNGTAQVGLPNRNSTDVVATGSPGGGEYIWSTSSDKVSLSPNGNRLTITAQKKSDQPGDVVINLSYKLSDGRHADTQINMTVQQPGSLKYVSTTFNGALAPSRPTRRQRLLAGWKKTIDWQVLDHLGQPMTFRMPVADTMNNKLPNDCFLGRMGHGTTLSESHGTGNGGQWTHVYELHSPACVNGGNCGVDGYQRYTINGFELSNDDKDYRMQCNGIQVEGDGSTLTPWTPPARKKTAMLVDQFYVAGFNDWASDDELFTWTTRLNNAAAQGQAQLLAEARALGRAVFDSAEYNNVNRSDEDFVADLYNAYLGRDPDQSGWNFWVSVYRNDLAQGVNGHEHLLQAFEQSTEFIDLVYSLETAPPPVVCDPVEEQACWNGGGLWDPSTCFCEYPPPYDPCYPYYCTY